MKASNGGVAMAQLGVEGARMEKVFRRWADRFHGRASLEAAGLCEGFSRVATKLHHGRPWGRPTQLAAGRRQGERVALGICRFIIIRLADALAGWDDCGSSSPVMVSEEYVHLFSIPALCYRFRNRFEIRDTICGATHRTQFRRRCRFSHAHRAESARSTAHKNGNPASHQR